MVSFCSTELTVSLCPHGAQALIEGNCGLDGTVLPAEDGAMSGSLQRWYDHHVMPRVVDLACRSRAIERKRQRIVPQAAGVVVEIGFGSALNLPHYDPQRVRHVIGLDPVAEMVGMGESRHADAPVSLEIISASAADMPLETASADTVLLTFTACTIPDIEPAMAEMRRVLKPGGRLLFCEHGRAPDPRVARWQDRLNPMWQRLAGGCHLNRDTEALLLGSGFRIDSIDAEYVPWTPKFAGYVRTGIASSP